MSDSRPAADVRSMTDSGVRAAIFDWSIDLDIPDRNCANRAQTQLHRIAETTHVTVQKL
jgi:hypothetical protein